jgi:hypothetical protein
MKCFRIAMITTCSLLIALAAVTTSQADVVIGDFEQTAPGWGRWSGGVQSWDANYTYSTDGATLNNYAVQYTRPGGGWAQSLAYSAGAAGTIADFLAHDRLLADITFPATAQTGWAELFEIVINSQYGGFTGQDANGPTGPVQVGWGPGGGGAQTITVEYDYANHKAAWAANGTPGWIEIVFATNSDSNHGFFQFDNVRLVRNIPEPAGLALGGIALAALAMLRCRA